MDKPEIDPLILKEYKERERFWTDKSLTQLSLSIQIHIGITVAVLGFVVKQDDKLCRCCAYNFDVISSIYFIASLLLLISLISGGLSIMSRSMDLRMTRHIAQVRRKFYQGGGGKINEKVDEKFSTCALIKISFSDFEEQVSSSENFKINFEAFRNKTNKLGKFTWQCHRYQILFLYISIILFALSHLA